MTISREHFSSVVFLMELSIQCDLFLRAYGRLKIASEHWINIDRGIDDGTKFSPLEILSESTVCLSAMSAINRLLFSGVEGRPKKRSARLLNFLDDIPLKSIQSKKVRNSWEHNDERMDKELSNIESYSPLSHIHVSVKPPKEHSCVLKRFDPVDLSISFLGDKVNLMLCFNEMQSLKRKIDEAFTKLNEHKTA
jgi:hypothetical protein